MRLAKNFLTVNLKAFEVSKVRIALGVIVGLLYAFFFYAVLYVTREGIRILSVTEENDLWVLEDDAVSFYNLIFAFIALIVGQSICFHFWLDRPKRFFSKLKIRQNLIVNDQRVLIWSFLSWFGKLAFLFGIFFGIHFYGINYVFSLYPDYNYIFILSIIVLFLQSWTGIRLTFKRGSFKWLLTTAVVISILAFGMSRINFIDYHKVNQSVLDKNVYYKYDLELPLSSFYEKPYSKYSLEEIYVVEENNKPIVLFKDEKISFEDFLNINDKKRISDRLNYRRSNFQLYIDKDIKMSFVKKLKDKLHELDIWKIGYGVMPEDLQYDIRYYRDAYLPDYLQSKDEESVSFLAEGIKEWKGKGVISYGVELKLDQVLFEGRSVSFEELINLFKHKITKKPSQLCFFYVDDYSNFDSYIKIKSSYKRAVRDFLDELSEKEYGRKYWSLEIIKKKKIMDEFNINFSLLEMFPEIEVYFPLK